MTHLRTLTYQKGLDGCQAMRWVKRESDLREEFFVLSLAFPIVVIFALVVVSNIRGPYGVSSRS